MNVVAGAVALWAALDAFFIAAKLAHRGHPHRSLLFSQPILALLAGVALLGAEPERSLSFWALGVVFNMSLAAAGFPLRRALSVVGMTFTLGSLALLALHSFASVALLLVASVVCAGACIPRITPKWSSESQAMPRIESK